MYTSHLLTASELNFTKPSTCLEIPVKKTDERKLASAPLRYLCLFIGLSFFPCKIKDNQWSEKQYDGEMTANDDSCYCL